MKHFYLFLSLLLFFNISFSQNKKLKEQLKSIENQWHIDEYDRVVYTESFNVLNTEKSILYKRVQKFIAFSFIPDFDETEIVKLDQSFIISAKGNIPFLQDMYTFIPYKNEYISTVFIIECNDNSVNLTVFFKEFITNYEATDNTEINYNLISVYPFDQKALGKNITGNAFYKSFIFTKEKIKALKMFLEGNEKA